MQKTKEELKCDICDKTFKDKSGLAGHKKITHNVETKKVIPNELEKRLATMEKQLATTINPKKVIESEKQARTALELLLAVAQKFDLALGPFGKQLPGMWRKREWVVKKASECPQEYF